MPGKISYKSLLISIDFFVLIDKVWVMIIYRSLYLINFVNFPFQEDRCECDPLFYNLKYQKAIDKVFSNLYLNNLISSTHDGLAFDLSIERDKRSPPHVPHLLRVQLGLELRLQERQQRVPKGCHILGV